MGDLGDKLNKMVGSLTYQARALVPLGLPSRAEFVESVVRSNESAIEVLCRVVPWIEGEVWDVLEALDAPFREAVFKSGSVPAPPLAVACLSLTLRAAGIVSTIKGAGMGSEEAYRATLAAMEAKEVSPCCLRAWDVAAAAANLPARMDCSAFGLLTWDGRILMNCTKAELAGIAELLADLYEVR